MRLFLYCLIFFLTSGQVVMRHPHSMSGYCDIPSNEWPNLDIPYVSQPDCLTYTQKEVFDYNFWYWTVGVLLGCQFTHLSRSDFFGGFIFSGNFLSYWTWKEYTILIGGVGILYYAFFTVLAIYSALGVLDFYLLALFGIVAFIAMGIAYFGIDRFHFHHYQMAMLLIFFSCL